MIRTTAVPRQLRVGAAAASVAGIALLAGCSGTTATPTETKAADVETTAAATPAPGATTDGGAAASDSVYTDGTYTAEGSYSTPESVEKITVTVAVADDIVTSVKVTGNPTRRESEQYQGQFIGGISDEVVGKNLDEVSVSRVAGSSLTSGGFNQAIEEIRSEAAA